ncbi:hypothetical protein E5S67_01830 [Microcoleus sp. IPMA8]|uniref:Uncharacterized protein n=1 Tax=Microcoleus asticus IPMA8 TaxID=2563858 RepID=A0ABX2CUM2_9CYAN|nr:hypothetical protein [Microcoleus asticus IPMA8]
MVSSACRQFTALNATKELELNLSGDGGKIPSKRFNISIGYFGRCSNPTHKTGIVSLNTT